MWRSTSYGAVEWRLARQERDVTKPGYSCLQRIVFDLYLFFQKAVVCVFLWTTQFTSLLTQPQNMLWPPAVIHTQRLSAVQCAEVKMGLIFGANLRTMPLNCDRPSVTLACSGKLDLPLFPFSCLLLYYYIQSGSNDRICITDGHMVILKVNLEFHSEFQYPNT